MSFPKLPPITPFALDLMKDCAKFLIGAGAGWILRTARERWRTRNARSFWRPFLSDDLCIVVGSFHEFKNFERSGLLGVGDAIALGELQTFLSRIGGKKVPHAYASRFNGDMLKQTLVVIGGPDANSVALEALVLFKSTFQVGPEDVAITDTTTTPPKLYSPNELDKNGSGVDYGLILCGPNPFCPNKMMMLIAGCYGHGTLAGARYVSSPEFLTLPQVQDGGKSFECLIKTDVMRDTPQAIHLIDIRKIENIAATKTTNAG
ncbi:MAG TPA: hypothetical protein VGK24_15070 [Candidatus Angelobacter sp.]|jgi:hypothetical protein